MKKTLGNLFAVTLFAGATVLASGQSTNTNTNNQNKTTGSYESKSTNTTTTDTGKAKTTTDIVYGKVEEYTPGKTLKVSAPGKTEGTRTFDLSASDLKAHVASNVKVGDWVAVREKTDNNGKKMISVTHSKHAARMGRESTNSNMNSNENGTGYGGSSTNNNHRTNSNPHQ